MCSMFHVPWKVVHDAKQLCRWSHLSAAWVLFICMCLAGVSESTVPPLQVSCGRWFLIVVATWEAQTECRSKMVPTSISLFKEVWYTFPGHMLTQAYYCCHYLHYNICCLGSVVALHVVFESKICSISWLLLQLAKNIICHSMDYFSLQIYCCLESGNL